VLRLRDGNSHNDSWLAVSAFVLCETALYRSSTRRGLLDVASPDEISCNAQVLQSRCRRMESPMTYWEIIANNLSKAGWRCGGISSRDTEGR
jgi:hypothetical protein